MASQLLGSLGSAAAESGPGQGAAAPAQAKEPVLAGDLDSAAGIHVLSGLVKSQTQKALLCVCSGCRRVKDSQGRWVDPPKDQPSLKKSNITHGICPDCLKRLYPDLKLNL